MAGGRMPPVAGGAAAASSADAEHPDDAASRGRAMRRSVALVVAATLVAAATVSPYRAVLVTGGSMRPSIQPADVVVYRTGCEPEVGEAVVFETDAGLVVHRVVRSVGPRSFVTRGDANPVEVREPIDRTAVRGEVRVVLGTGRLLRLAVGLLVDNEQGGDASNEEGRRGARGAAPTHMEGS
jgi:signal peptidase I